METIELRIGNYIYRFGIDYVDENIIVDRTDFEVVEVDIEILQNIQDNDGTTDYDYFEPIPLTEEWLLKFGFKEEFDGLYSKGIFNISADFERINMIHPAYDLQIKYAHELQNLYFALTGEELEIK